MSISSIFPLKFLFICLFIYLFVCLFTQKKSHTCFIVVLGDPNEIDVHRRMCRVKSRDFL